MKHFLNLIVLLLILSAKSFAQSIITVSTNPRMDTDFHDLQAALDAANAGDTIYIHGNGYYNGTYTVTKKLHLIGPGYLLIDNNKYNTDGGDALVYRLEFNAGSDSSSVEGLHFTNYVYVSAESIHIRKNRFSYDGASFGNIQFMADVHASYIYNNLIDNRLYNAISAGSSVDTVESILANNIIQGSLSLPAFVDDVNLTIVNNTLVESSTLLKLENAYVANNIFIEQSINVGSNVTAENNIFRGSLPVGIQAVNNNVPSVNMADIFSTPNLSFFINGDAEFTDLKPAPNPATTNCGPQGCGVTLGVNPPYRNSGIPEIPILYELISDVEPDSLGQLHFQVKARSY